MVDAALDDPMWRRSLIGSDAEVGAILIEVKSTQGKLQSSLANALEQALEPAQKSGWSFYLAGELIDFTYTGAYLERESTRMAGPLALVLRRDGLVRFQGQCPHECDSKSGDGDCRA
jgi:hypothetical protein